MRNPARRRILRSFVLLLAATSVLAAGAGAATGVAAGAVVHLSLDGVVDPFEANYISGGIAAAQRDGAAAVLLTIDTPGGLDSSMREITQAILNANVPVIGYVSPEGARAASAGAFVLMATPIAAMAPGTNVGAATPVGISGATLNEKVTQDAAAYMQSLAEHNGRNVEVARSFVLDATSISAETALADGVIDLISSNVDQLLADVDGKVVTVANGARVTLHTAGAPVETLNMSIGASLFHALLTPDLAFIFFYLGLGLIVIEVLHPGVSIPGLLGALCLIAAFVAFGMLPVQIVGVALLVASVVFFLLELKHPGLGAFTVGGVVTLVLGGLTLFNPNVPGARVSPWVIGCVALALVAFFATAVTALMKARRMPKSEPSAKLVGATGIVLRDLVPEGIVQVGSEQWTASTAGTSVRKGAIVRIVRVDGLRLRVEPMNEQAPAGPAPGGR